MAKEWTVEKKIIVYGEKIAVGDLSPATIMKVAQEKGIQRFVVASDPDGVNLLTPSDKFEEIDTVYIFPKEKVG